jgi:RNA polymerase sigma-70 factor (ECF subfamily)
MRDSELAGRASRGDREAFQQLLERHYDTAYRVALRYAGNIADAEDIAQNVCLGLAGKIGSFKGRASFSTWLYRVVVNACRDFARKQKSTRTLQENYAVYRALDDADQADTVDKVNWLNEAVAELEPKLRETAILVLAEDLNHAQAAEVLGCAESTVSWRMHEVRKKLKSRLEETDD